MTDLTSQLMSIATSARHVKCWYVSYGGVTHPTFELALGDKVRRRRPLQNPAQAREFRLFEGSYNLLVWCSWRLDSSDRSLAGSTDVPDTIATTLRQLVGASVNDIRISAPCWDMSIHFSNGMRLSVFCNHVPGDPPVNGNWDVFTPTAGLYVGPGSSIKVEART